MVTLPGGRGLLRQLGQELFPHLSSRDFSQQAHAHRNATKGPELQMILGS